MKRIFVAGMYSKNSDGSVANMGQVMEHIRKGQKMCHTLICLGYTPFCPWLGYQYLLHGSLGDRDLKDVSLAWLEVSECIMVISGEGAGTGVDVEIVRAKELGIPRVRLSDGDLKIV